SARRSRREPFFFVGESSKSSYRISTEAVTPRPYHSSRTTVDLDLFGLEKKFGAQCVATLPGAGRWVGHRLRAGEISARTRKEETKHNMGKGKIIITGASAGLGAEMAHQFAALGYDLGLCARRREKMEALRSAVIAAHPERTVELRALDVTDHDAVFTVFHELSQALGGVDRVIVNAGLGKGAALGKGRADANRRTAMTNFVGALSQSEAAMEIFRAQGRGHLVMISSMSALRGMRKAMTVYAATKAGLASLAEGLRSERV